MKEDRNSKLRDYLVKSKGGKLHEPESGDIAWFIEMPVSFVHGANWWKKITNFFKPWWKRQFLLEGYYKATYICLKGNEEEILITHKEVNSDGSEIDVVGLVFGTMPFPYAQCDSKILGNANIKTLNEAMKKELALLGITPVTVKG